MSMRRRPSLMGALLWIALGLTFLLHNFGIGPDLSWAYKRYWPLLLILLGLGKILDYSFKQNALGVRFGELVLLIIAFTLGCLATRTYAIDPINFFQRLPFEIASVFHQPEFTYTEETTYPFDSSGFILIDNSFGSISVSPGTDREIRVRLRKVITGDEDRTKSMAKEIRLETNTEGSKSGSVFVIRTNRNALNSRGWRFRTDMEILVPKNSQLQVTNMFGEVRAANLNGFLDLSTSHQPINVQDCSGKFDISIRNSQCRLSNLIGDVSIKNEFSSLEIYNIDGKLSVTSNQGSMAIDTVTKPVTIDGRGTFIRAQNLKDSLKILTAQQNVELSGIAGAVTMDTRYTSLSLKDIKGNVHINSNTDTINADEIMGGLTIAARGSGIHLNNIQGPLDVRTSLREVLVNDFASSCTVHNEYGNISVTAQTLGKGDITLKNQTGAIDLYLPENAAFEMDATARNGRVELIHEELRSFPNQTSNENFFKFKSKDGGPKILLETNNNNIRLFNSFKNKFHRMPKQKQPRTMPASIHRKLAYDNPW
jgi:DUF4097 and DUF4098 domain-containing protein YvlB